MPAIMFQPVLREAVRISTGLAGGEYLEFGVALDNRMRFRFANTHRKFPKNGYVSISRGFKYGEIGNQYAGEFRYEESYKDGDTGALVPECFQVFLNLEESAFDRLVQRFYWGLAEFELSLYFDLSCKVITFTTMSGDPFELEFDLTQGPCWEKVDSATVKQCFVGNRNSLPNGAN